MNIRSAGWQVTVVAISAAALVNCGGDSNGSEVDERGAGARGGSQGSGADSGNGASSATAGTLSIDFGGGSSSGGGRTRGDGTPEVCDGKDNDSNGIIDDVDAGNDGVCDCLNIATIGHIGPWSNGGNIFADWLDARSPIGAVELANEEITAEKLRPFQVVVVLHVATTAAKTTPAHHAFSSAEVNAFEAWVRGGGGVMSTIGYTGDEASEVVNVNKLLSGLGVGYSATKLSLTGFVTDWMRHPVTDGVRKIRTDNGVEPDGAGDIVARGEDNRVALQVAQLDQGRAVIWGDEWVTYDSEWTDVKDQQVELFWLNLLKWLTPPTECQVPIPPPLVQ